MFHMDELLKIIYCHDLYPVTALTNKVFENFFKKNLRIIIVIEMFWTVSGYVDQVYLLQLIYSEIGKAFTLRPER